MTEGAKSVGVDFQFRSTEFVPHGHLFFVPRILLKIRSPSLSYCTGSRTATDEPLASTGRCSDSVNEPIVDCLLIGLAKATS